jgi:mannosylglycoprotein endo-beta-mannosidase
MISGTVSVKVNNTTRSYFKSGRGVRQGDPLSPFLFNIAVDALAKMISLVQKNKLIQGLVPEYIGNIAIC